MKDAKLKIFKPIKLERVSDKVASQLKEAIGAGTFRVGDRLPSERELGETMGVSRASVREAIQQLELLGLVESLHGGGTLVKNLTEQELQTPMEIILGEDIQKIVELTEVRAFMEAWAAKQAAELRSEEQLERMKFFLEEMELDLEKGLIRAEIDTKFHMEIAAAANNTIFMHLMHTIHQLVSYSVKLSREILFQDRTDQELIFQHHLQVFKAIQKRDPVRAESAMAEHLLFVIAEYKRKFFEQ
jgi:GntR family transcriptional regulator, transcriptional repressor for pyruvate dehydrogenase complex